MKDIFDNVINKLKFRQNKNQFKEQQGNINF